MSTNAALHISETSVNSICEQTNAALYVNPYFVVTPKGYTKHVYNGSQRICSEIGDITRLPDNIIDSTLNTNDTLNRISLNSISNYAITTLLPIQLQADNSTFADIDGEDYEELQWQCFDEPTDITFTSSGIRELLYPVLSRDTSHVSNESAGNIYLCHTDHLGSATLITDIYGNAVQFMHYMPYGELFLNQQATNYNERFKFTGKERDTETGYDYFGARYYSPDLTAWLSPDPLLDKYPSFSPYAYCENNPIRYVDPDGKEKIISLSQNNSQTSSLEKAANAFPQNSTVIHLWAHGNNNSIKIVNSDKNDFKYLTSASEVNSFLWSTSELWQNRDIGDPAMIVLHSCSTGAGENSIAEIISNDPIFENVLIVAPTKNIQVVNGIEYGPADHDDLNNMGDWRMFLNGTEVNSFNGRSTPIFDNVQEQVNRYKTKSHE